VATDSTVARWELFEHGADIGVRGIAGTIAGAFEHAAIALTAVSVDPACIRCETTVEIRCEAPDVELLLVDWLNAVIYETATRSMVFARFRVAIEGNRLDGRALGEALDRSRHEPAVEVKGATYTALAVGRDDDGNWVAQCVVDV
jgi:SHS2 domain-containing protein